MWTVTICFALRAMNHHDTSLAQRIQHGFHTHQNREHLPLQCRGPSLVHAMPLHIYRLQASPHVHEANLSALKMCCSTEVDDAARRVVLLVCSPLLLFHELSPGISRIPSMHGI